MAGAPRNREISCLLRKNTGAKCFACFVFTAWIFEFGATATVIPRIAFTFRR